MSFGRFLPCLFLLLPLLPGPAPSRADEPEVDYDREMLKEHGLKAEGPALLDFFRGRTLDDAKRKKVQQLIRDLGHPRFAVRDKASKELAAFGPSVRKTLQEAVSSPDPEIASRARRCLEQIESGPGPGLPAAAARALKRLSAPQAAPVLLDYLPFADDLSVEEEVIGTLAVVGVRDGKPDPALVAAASDPNATKRSAAGFVLGRLDGADYRRAAKKLLDDREPWVRLRAAQGLIAGKQKEGVPALFALLNDVPAEATWQAEELLRRIAGEKAPLPATEDTPAAKKKYREAWAAWWEKDGPAVDLAKLPETPRLLGLTVGIEYNTNAVWEAGPDGKKRWSVQADGPMDAQVLPGDRVLVAEQNTRRVTIRDFKGSVLWEKKLADEPINCQQLTNGNVWIGTRNDVLEVRKDGTEVYRHKISETYMHAVRRLPNGHHVGLTNNGVIEEIDARGKKVRTVTMTHEGTWGDVDGLPGGRYLVANYGTGYIREVDSNGKALWTIQIGGACGVDRLPDGKYLVGCPSRSVIVDRAGNVVWEAKSEGSVRRTHRR